MHVYICDICIREVGGQKLSSLPALVHIIGHVFLSHSFLSLKYHQFHWNITSSQLLLFSATSVLQSSHFWCKNFLP